MSRQAIYRPREWGRLSSELVAPIISLPALARLWIRQQQHSARGDQAGANPSLKRFAPVPRRKARPAVCPRHGTGRASCNFKDHGEASPIPTTKTPPLLATIPGPRARALTITRARQIPIIAAISKTKAGASSALKQKLPRPARAAEKMTEKQRREKSKSFVRGRLRRFLLLFQNLFDHLRH